MNIKSKIMKYFSNLYHLGILVLFIGIFACQYHSQKSITDKFPPQMVLFGSYEENPIFSGTNSNTWDKYIRERGYILKDEGIYKMWYTGYNGGDSSIKYLGYSTSTDGVKWSRYQDQPIFNDKWTEDIFVIKDDGIYYMYAEGKNDIAHLLISTDGINWNSQGNLIIFTTNGDTIPAPYGTPTVWIEDNTWYLFYERNDLGIWLATSKDKINWMNIQDEPVLKMGPEKYDEGAVAANQIVKYNNRYFMYYHGSTNPNWANPEENAEWSSLVAMSTDLINWTKYPDNPLVKGDTSSPILVFDDHEYRLYTMHDKVCVYFPVLH
ncbi:putative 6(G)-fructosyltransferase [Proteiniphilum saccharofermentans]|uniref:Putative 6(G)-fructosyltransferase n=1 Tax=Proteiniphilum saccharofermentans TaxID=1642647 RepID=A0A1R3T0A1_9BACT|nr:hypothetical protein [Proteiniphilum saccharofermentans]SCD21843.1 putative 6(G)-fructosyltransferase [Proteiniphilum saccharofermentans]